MKGATEVRGLTNIKSASRVHLRSAPRRQVTYMDLYTLQKEKERLETELSRLEKRKQVLSGRLEELKEVLASGLEKLNGGKEPDTEPTAGKPPWPRMKLEY